MIRLPNKLYRFEETVLANFVTVLRTVGDQSVSVTDFHEQPGPEKATEDMVDALALLLALGKIQLPTDSGVIARAH